MSPALVSAIITTHNRCELLVRAIESVLSQTYSELECIVVDDASEDETPEVCKRYPVIYIQIPKEESRGGNYARNLGIKASKGAYCAFLELWHGYKRASEFINSKCRADWEQLAAQTAQLMHDQATIAKYRYD